jgi:hypothetical protein
MRRMLLALALLPAVAGAQVYTNPTATLPAGITPIPNTGLNGPMGTGPLQANNPATAQAQAQQENPGKQQQEARAAANSEGQTYTAGKTPTAAEQGITPNTAAQDRQALADYNALHTPRQLGQTVPQLAPYHPVATDRSAAGWLANWAYTLERAGVPSDKVNFEAGRLDRDAFGAWANRQLITLPLTQ